MIHEKVITNGQVNWDYVETLPEFARLKTTEQCKKWHSEGVVWQHTVNVVNALLSLPEYKELNKDEKDVLLFAALFHDVGKGVTTKRNEEGEWSSKGHATASEKITRNMLWEMKFSKREMICHLTKLHMKPKYLTEKSTPQRHVTLYGILVPVKMLYILSKADTLGATPENIQGRIKTLEDLEYFKEYSIEAGVWDGISHLDVNKYSLYRYINNDDLIFLNGNYLGLQPSKFKVHIVCGVAGSGKDTFIKFYDNLPVISLDAIRTELGIKNGKGSKKQESEVIEIAKERAKAFCREKKSFIWNATCIHKMHRNTILNIANQYGAEIKICVIEAPINECIKRRQGTIPSDVIKKMFETFDYPNILECHELECYKQYR